MSTTVVANITTGLNDSYEETNGNSNHISSTSLHFDTVTQLIMGIVRAADFTPNAPPQGATIVSATLQVEPFSTTNLVLNCQIYFEAVDSPVSLASSSFNISGRTKTTNHTTFATTLVSSSFSTSANISAQAQEVDSRAGYTGDYGIILVGDGILTTDLAAADLSTAKSMILTITYNTGGGVTPSNYITYTPPWRS